MDDERQVSFTLGGMCFEYDEQKNQTNIGNIKAYLLTALYNSTITMDSYYQARVNYDLRENF